MKPLLSLGTIVLAVAAATMQARAEGCVPPILAVFVACPPTTPSQPPAPVVAKRRDQDEKAPPAKPPPALPPRIDSEMTLHAPVSAGGSAQAKAK